MSKVFPEVVADALGLVHDITIDLVGEDTLLFRGTVTRNEFDEEAAVYDFTAPETIKCHLKYSPLPQMFAGFLYDENDLPVEARIENKANVKQFDMLLVPLKGLDRSRLQWKKYTVIEVLAVIASNVEVYATYRLTPDRTAREIWIAVDWIDESFEDPEWEI